MIASRSSNGMNADFIALIVNRSQVAPAVAERLDEPVHLLAHRGVAHQPVVGVDGDAEPQPGQQVERMLGDAVDRAGLHIAARAHLERNPLVPQQRCQPTEGSAPSGATEMSSTIRTPWPSRSAPQNAMASWMDGSPNASPA